MVISGYTWFFFFGAEIRNWASGRAGFWTPFSSFVKLIYKYRCNDYFRTNQDIDLLMFAGLEVRRQFLWGGIWEGGKWRGTRSLREGRKSQKERTDEKAATAEKKESPESQIQPVSQVAPCKFGGFFIPYIGQYSTHLSQICTEFESFSWSQFWREPRTQLWPFETSYLRAPSDEGLP